MTREERMWTWREALMIGTLRSLEARMTNSDPEGTCKKVVENWLADIRTVIKDAEMPDIAKSGREGGSHK